MRILHTADLHERLEWYDWVRSQSASYDVLVIAGDFLNFLPSANDPLPMQAQRVCKWLGELQKPAVVCTGNHDSWPRNPLVAPDTWADGNWLQLCEREGLVIDGQSASLCGEQFAAVKWRHADWHVGASIVVAHAPPARTRISIDASGVDFGDLMVAERILQKRPKFVFSGHVHSAAEWHEVVGSTHCFNPGCDWMALVPNHIVVNTVQQTARWFTAKKGYLEKKLITPSF